MERKVIKKIIISVTSYLILEGLFLKAVSHIDVDMFEFIDVINIIGATVVFALVLKTIFYPYMVIENGSISIFHDFYKESFRVDEIAALDVTEKPFSKSNFELKSRKNIKFDSFAISKKNLNYLEKLCEDLS